MTGRLAPQVVALSGGVGGAKLAAGLAAVLPPEELTVVCNTGDDFEPYGLYVCPDLDSVTYALAGLADEERGWGRAGESWAFMEALRGLGEEGWFSLGDRDLALHVWRTAELRAGKPLSAVTAAAARRLGVRHRILPMSDAPVRTRLRTDAGELEFQEYFVRRRAEPRVLGLHYAGSELADVPAGAAQWLDGSPPRAIVICPSNPFLSIDPILSLRRWRHWVRKCAAPVVAVSPIVGGRALKGCAAKMMAELGHEVSALGIARHYVESVDGLVIDEQDAALAPAIEALGIACRVAPTVMHTVEDRQALARATLAFDAQVGLRERPVQHAAVPRTTGRSA
jgi:LPPG:FO 2-phospho-L-lactate transferase